MSQHVTNQRDYAGVATQLAKQALSIARDAAPHRAREGERRFEMARLLPAARVLIGEVHEGDAAVLQDIALELAQTLADPTGKVTDGFGHSRPVYAWFAIHLLGTASALVNDDGVLGQAHDAGDVLRRRYEATEQADLSLAIWCRLMARQHGIEEADELPRCISDGLQRLSLDRESKPLVEHGPDDLIDSWTYNELVGLHGLHLCSLIEADDALTQRVRSVALYHLGHTQPDYTTYQPWGLAAFAGDPATATFAEQQLHDVATHLNLSGPGGAVMPALLLADNVAAMSGTLGMAWGSVNE